MHDPRFRQVMRIDAVSLARTKGGRYAFAARTVGAGAGPCEAGEEQMDQLTRERTDAVRPGELTYLAESVESSLYGNGGLFLRRDNDGNDSPWQGVELEKRLVPVHDARNHAHTLDVNGFELVACPVESPDFDWLDHDLVVRRYYPHCADIVREGTGARLVRAFDHNIRSVSGNRSRRRPDGGQQVQQPIHIVHGDYTLDSGPRRLRDLAKAPTANDTYRTTLAEGRSLLDGSDVAHALGEGRFAIINLWRNIAPEPVAREPLALCDATSVDPDDLAVFEIYYSDRTGENYWAKHADSHRWYFYPALTRDEALLIKQWDSDGGLARSKGAKADAECPENPCTFSFHSAFEDPATAPDAPDRWSIEVRCVALYD